MGRTDLAIVIGIQRWLRLILGWINSNKFYLLLWPGSGKKAIVGKESGRGWKQIDRNSKGVELGVDSRGLKWHKLRTGESGCLLCFLVGEIGKGYELRDTPIKLWTNPRFSVSEKAFPYCCIFLICLIYPSLRRYHAGNKAWLICTAFIGVHHIGEASPGFACPAKQIPWGLPSESPHPLHSPSPDAAF